MRSQEVHTQKYVCANNDDICRKNKQLKLNKIKYMHITKLIIKQKHVSVFIYIYILVINSLSQCIKFREVIEEQILFIEIDTMLFMIDKI